MNKSSIPWTTNQIVRMCDNNSLRFDNAIQRGEVWDIQRKSRFIDSVLRDFPVPPLYCVKTDKKVTTPKGESSVYECIDGKQRCTTLHQFRNGLFALSGLKPIMYDGNELDINGLCYGELPKLLQEDISTASFIVYFFSNITPDEIADMMDRLNNGKPLSGIEKARIMAIDLNSIMEMSSHELFGEFLSEKALLNYANEDIVIKSYIELFTPDDPSFDNRKVQEVYRTHSFSDYEKSKLTALFDKTREVLSYIESNANKKAYRKVLRKTNMLAAMYYIGNSSEEVNVIGEKISAFFTTEDNALSQSIAYNEASTNATNRAANVRLRMEAIEEFCDKSSNQVAPQTNL